MIRALAFALAVFAASPVWAGCSNYTDGSLAAQAPAVEFCYRGSCEASTVNYICGNAHGAQISLANGWLAEVGEDLPFTLAYNGEPVADPTSATCYFLENGTKTKDVCDVFSVLTN